MTQSEKILRFLNQEMTPEEKIDFQNEMARDADLRKKVTYLQDVERAHFIFKKGGLKDELNNIWMEGQKNQSGDAHQNWTKLRIFLQIAATLVIFITLSYVILFRNAGPLPQPPQSNHSADTSQEVLDDKITAPAPELANEEKPNTENLDSSKPGNQTHIYENLPEETYTLPPSSPDEWLAANQSLIEKDRLRSLDKGIRREQSNSRNREIVPEPLPQIDILEPGANQFYRAKEPLKIAWQSEALSGKIRIKIFNKQSQNQPLVKTLTPQDSPFLLEHTLRPGLYYFLFYLNDRQVPVSRSFYIYE